MVNLVTRLYHFQACPSDDIIEECIAYRKVQLKDSGEGQY